MNIQALNRNPWVKAALDFFYPPLCLGCGEYHESAGNVCDRCLDAVKRYDYPLCLNCLMDVISGPRCPHCGEDAFVLFAWGHYIDPLRAVIHQFKFKGITSPANIFTEALDDQFGDRIKAHKTALLVPIPLHPSREYTRGYNQSALLAKALGRRLGLTVDDGLLVRREKRKPQSRLKNEHQRRKNVVGVFEVTRAMAGDEDDPEVVILVDDVVTSGATVYEARRVLKDAGYLVPAVIAAAHGE